MKNIFRLLLCALLLPCVPDRARAQLLAQDDAAAYNTAGTWTNGMNLGYGFGPWTLVATNVGGYSGFFIGNGGPIATAGNSAWGLYGNGTVTNIASSGNAAVAYRPFTNALPVNGLFKIKWRNLGIGGDLNPPYHQGGFALRNGNANASVEDYLTGARLAFYYIGGVDDNFRILDGNGVLATGLGFSSGPFEINVLLLSTDTYRLLVKNPTGTAVIASFDGPLAGASTIDSVALYNFQCDGDQVFNSMAVSTTSLLPPGIENVQPAAGSVYVAASAPITFNVVSEFSGVATNNIVLTLNGTNVSGLSFSGTVTNWSVTKTGALVDNAIYDAVIIVTDLNGNKATNSFSFNTWRADNFFIEAEDYNFSGGGFIPAYFPNGYTNLLGVNGIDYLDSPGNGTSIYRPTDLPATEYAPDIDHNNFLANEYVDFSLAYIQYGEWENYTRRLSNTTFQVYARMTGGGDNPVMLLERLASPTATTSNQPLAALGTFVGTNTFSIISNFTFVPLKDFFSSNVLMRFSRNPAGTTNTLRLTRIGDGYNLNYLIFVPTSITSTQRPYLSAGFPYPGAANVAPDQTLSFTIANRETAVTPASIQLFVNDVNVTGGITTSNNAAGCVVTYTPGSFYPLGGTSTVRVVYTDSDTITQTNTWQFTVANPLVIPAEFALPGGSGSGSGFNLQIAKAPNADESFVPFNIERVEQHLAGLLTNNLGQPLVNEADGDPGDGIYAGLYAETGVINYEQCGTTPAVDGDTFPLILNAPFPYVVPGLYSPCQNDAPGGPNLISLAAVTYLELSPGLYRIAVRSDDGFRLTTGTGPNPTNLTVMEYLTGRSSATPSETEFVVQQAGLYPFKLQYFEGTFGASLEFYSINRSNGVPTLINDTNSPAAIKAYRAAGAASIPLNIERVGNNVVLTWSNPAFALQAAPLVTGTYTNVPGATSPYTNSLSEAQKFFRLKN